MNRINRLRYGMLSFGVFLAVLFLYGPTPVWAEPSEEPGQAAETENAGEQRIEQEIKRIVGNIKVSVVEDGEERQLDLLDGPLLKHEFAGRFVRGTVWAWSAPGRPLALLSLSVTGPADDPQWCHEMVSLTTEPIKASTRGKTWWSAQTAGWNPTSIPDAPEVAETSEQRLSQMKELARRFSGFVYQNPQNLTALPLLEEPILRYPASGYTIDGATFVLTAHDKNPEILLVIEAEQDPQGDAAWKYNVSPLSSNGLTLKYNEKLVWNRPVINWLSTKPTDTYRIYLLSAKEELRLREADGRK